MSDDGVRVRKPPMSSRSAAVRLFSGSFANAYVLLILTPLFWGGNAVAGKLASGEWGPFTLTALRWILVCLCLLPLGWRAVWRDRVLIRQHIVLLLLLGAVGQGGFNLCLYLALNYTSAINVSIEQAAMPVLIMLMSFVILGQRVVWLQIVGLLLTVVGVLLTATHGRLATFFEGGLNRGDLLMILGSVFYAGYSFGLRWRPRIHWLSFLLVMSVGACLGTVPFALWESTQGLWQPVSVHGWLVLLYIAVFPSILGQLFYARGVELLGANRAGLFINLVPIFGALLAVLILGESFRWFHAAGLALVLAGIMLAEHGATRRVVTR